MRVCVITVSDTAARGEREDRSGPAVAERCQALGWEIAHRCCTPDERAEIQKILMAQADSADAVDLILTTGGTGIGPRDRTPEATIAVCDRLIPGFAEEMRRKGTETTPRAALSRAVAGVRGQTLIVNLPGSPKGAVESLDAIAGLLPHAAQVVRGARHD
jgi:molybdenum cofactor synthesis domain-containing protein